MQVAGSEKEIPEQNGMPIDVVSSLMLSTPGHYVV